MGINNKKKFISLQHKESVYNSRLKMKDWIIILWFHQSK